MDAEMKERHMIPFELPVYFFHRLMNELNWGVGICRVKGDTLHNPAMCKRLHKMLAAQVGVEIVEGKDGT